MTVRLPSGWAVTVSTCSAMSGPSSSPFANARLKGIHLRRRRGRRRAIRSSGPAVPPGHHGPRTVPSDRWNLVPNNMSPIAFTYRRGFCGRIVGLPNNLRDLFGDILGTYIIASLGEKHTHQRGVVYTQQAAGILRDPLRGVRYALLVHDRVQRKHAVWR